MVVGDVGGNIIPVGMTVQPGGVLGDVFMIRLS